MKQWLFSILRRLNRQKTACTRTSLISKKYRKNILPADPYLLEIASIFQASTPFTIVEIRNSYNAWAWIDPLLGPCVGVGQRLRDQVDRGALSAIIAHEIGHLYFHDAFTKKMLRILGLFSMINISLWSTMSYSYYGLIMFSIAGFFLYLLLLWTEREMEYRADLFATSFVPVDDLLRAFSSTRIEKASWIKHIFSTHPQLYIRRKRLYKWLQARKISR